MLVFIYSKLKKIIIMFEIKRNFCLVRNCVDFLEHIDFPSRIFEASPSRFAGRAQAFNVGKESDAQNQR